MKTLEKPITNKLPKAKFIKDEEGLAFLKDIKMFTQKTANAKERLKNVSLPLR